MPAEVEAERVRPVIEHLHAEGIRTSVDTMRASTARVAAAAGVDMINDVSAGLADPEMYRVMAEANLPVCLMHWRTDVFGDAAGASDHGGDVTGDVHALLNQCIDGALAAGVKRDQIVVDPGLGFAKTAEENWRLLASLPEFIAGPYPVLVGASRKRFLTAIRAERGLEHGPEDADPATAAVTAIAAQMGAWCVRARGRRLARRRRCRCGLERGFPWLTASSSKACASTPTTACSSTKRATARGLAWTSCAGSTSPTPRREMI